MVKIVFKNGCVVKWKEKEYTDYKYDGKWAAFYNMDSVVSIIVK